MCVHLISVSLSDWFMRRPHYGRVMKRRVVPVLAVILILTSGCTSGPPDLDGDGISDSEDLDIDGDGWDNDIELNCSTCLLYTSDAADE